jgi:hypothetical protein
MIKAMRSWLRGFSILVSVWACLQSGAAQAGEASYSELSRKLAESPDFRVRTQAALALGATGNRQAVEPLCSALKDANTTVRAASGAALGRLALGGKQCLEERLRAELTEEVRTVLKRALARLADPPAVIGPDAKFYVAIGDATNDTKRPNAEIAQLVRAHLVKELAKTSGLVVAPAGEKPEQATLVLAKHPKVSGMYVWPKVSATYARGSLVLNMELAVFSYPGKAFRGTISKKLTMPDVPSVDISAENDLLEMAAQRLIPDLERNAGRL